MAPQRVTKYQAIEAVLRRQILSGEYAPGSRLPAQEELASQFGVTLMTLRQALSALEASGLIWAARGKGTFVAEKPVDIRYDNLSSFTAQMRAADTGLITRILDVEPVEGEAAAAAADALGFDGPLVRLTRLRLVGDVPLSLQRSLFDRSLVPLSDLRKLDDASLYELLEERTGWAVTEARETITAVDLVDDDARLLDTVEGHAALLSIRTTINQLGQPYLYDEALLVGGRSTIVADRTSDRLSLRYGLAEGDDSP